MRMERHLGECAECRRLLAGLRRTCWMAASPPALERRCRCGSDRRLRARCDLSEPPSVEPFHAFRGSNRA